MGFGDVLGSTAAAAASFFGQRSANNANRNIAREANTASAESAQKQMDFQERMSNTQWQRGVADMKAAGINPMLAFSQGGASSPGGASYSAIGGQPQQNAMSPAVSSAVQAARALADLENVKATTENIKANTNRTKATQPVADLEGSTAGLIHRGVTMATNALSSVKRSWNTASFASARRIHEAQARRAAFNAKYGLWDKRTGEIHR